MAETPNLGFESASLGFSCQVGGEGEKGSQKFYVSNQGDSFQDRKEKSDIFVVDMESLSHGIDKDITPNSRITLQRSFSRKASQRGERSSNSNTTISMTSERDTVSASAAASAAPQAIVPMVVVGTTDAITPEGQQIKITTKPAAENKGRRYVAATGRHIPWVLDPWRILFFFATLSSMGTIVLIYFTLSLSKLSGVENSQSQLFWYW